MGRRANLKAAGHLFTPNGICPKRAAVYERTNPAPFAILQQRSPDVILGMIFPNQHGPVIDLKCMSIFLATDQALPPERIQSHRALSVLEDQVSIEPGASIIISGTAEGGAYIESITKKDQQLLFDCESGVARGIVQLGCGKPPVIVPSNSRAVVPEPAFDINPSLSMNRQPQLR